MLHVVTLDEGVRLKKGRWQPARRVQLESLLLAPRVVPQVGEWRGSPFAVILAK
jgi:hypothetical protein